MFKRFFFIVMLVGSSNLMAQVTIRLKIISFPKYHAAGSGIYAAGTFNGWHPEEEQYRFQKDEKGNFSLTLYLLPGNYQYKLTRGDWDKVECTFKGKSIDNRIINADTDQTIELTVEEWQDRFPRQPKASTYSKNVQVINSNFVIPQLKRTRRISIYLPEDYHNEPDKRYPVLYMQDGQNIFDDATSYSGEWGIDEFLDTATVKSCIVVAIDHAGKKRVNEYNPYDNKRFGKGQGNAYVDFIVKTLRPFVNKNYRTFDDKKNTFIAGSSMGGLISLYAVLKYPQVFEVAGIFSPSLRIAGPGIYDEIKAAGKNVDSKIYFYCGKMENKFMEPDMVKAIDLLKKLSNAEIKASIRKDGQHNELTWKGEFPLFYSWMISVVK